MSASDSAPTPEQVSLFFTEGSSDKEYHVQLRQAPTAPDAWVVDFQNGRRGKALASGTKTAQPVGFAEAKKIYDKLVSEKTKKGYTPDVSGAVFQDTVQGEQFSGCLPQLPTVVRDEAQIEAMLDDPNWWIEEKHDGDNRQVRSLADGSVQGINKRGLVVALPQSLADGVAAVPGPFLASAEIIGTTLHVFDIQELDGKDLRGLSYRERYALRAKVVQNMRAAGADVEMVTAATTSAEKRALMEAIRDRAGEGVVFKRAAAVFEAGKQSATSADQFKWKFTEDCTVRVSKVSKSKRSISVEIDGPDGVMDLGSVTIPSNQDIPSAGDLVSVTYLHLYEGGSLFQSTYKGVRTDCEGPDALDQFKIKDKQPAKRAKP